MEGFVAAALAAGVLGGVHCAGMCGGIAASLSMASRGSPLARGLAFNAGRIASYALAGAAVGGLSGLAQPGGGVIAVQATLFALANVLMLLLGLYVAGWGRAILRLEAAGSGLWRRIEPLRRRFFPIDSALRAFGAGSVWGWVPCGLVYSMLALALASGGAASGALVMAAFGLGTLPNLLAAGIASRRLLELRRVPWVRRLAGGGIAAFAIAGLARVPGVDAALAAGWACLH